MKLFRFLKVPRGVYYLSLSRILKSIFTFSFRDMNDDDKVASFEIAAAKLIEAPIVKAMPHARISLYYLIISYGLQPGDEVVMSPTTLPDMVNMILLAGMRPVFADFFEGNHFIDLNSAKNILSEKTKILFVTHLYGILPDMIALSDFAREHKLILIQDCTQSYGCKFNAKALIEYADSSFFSTCSLKDLHTHMGSILYSKDQSVMAKISESCKADFKPISKIYFWKFLKEDFFASLALNHLIFSFFTYYLFAILFNVDPTKIEELINGNGIKLGPFIFFKGLFAGTGDVRRHSIPLEMLYKFNNLQAEVGLQGIDKIKIFEEKRRSNTLLLIEHLSDNSKMRLPTNYSEAHNSFWRLPIFVDDPKDFESYLFKNNIDPGKTTLPCLSSLDIFKEFNRKTPVAEKMGKHSIFIPNFHYLHKGDMLHIASVINSYFVS